MGANGAAYDTQWCAAYNNNRVTYYFFTLVLPEDRHHGRPVGTDARVFYYQ